MSIAWIAVDWGTSNLRIWAMGEGGMVMEEKRSDQGMSTLKPHEFEPVLLSHIEGWLGDAPMPVIACGMVGSRQGWLEAPYIPVPDFPASGSVRVSANDPRLDVHIIAGMKQMKPCDVIRGEETQIAGFLAEKPEFEGVICLPGTHSKWVEIEGGQILGFQTLLTGELFALLSQQSVLRHSLGAWDDACFLESFDNAYQAPQNMTRTLFEIRAANLLEGDPCGVARLSGTLIGAEIAAMKDIWRARQIVIAGSDALVRLYGLAFEHLHVEAKTMHAHHLTLKGLTKVYETRYGVQS